VHAVVEVVALYMLFPVQEVRSHPPLQNLKKKKKKKLWLDQKMKKGVKLQAKKW